MSLSRSIELGTPRSQGPVERCPFLAISNKVRIIVNSKEHRTPEQNKIRFDSILIGLDCITLVPWNLDDKGVILQTQLLIFGSN